VELEPEDRSAEDMNHTSPRRPNLANCSSWSLQCEAQGADKARREGRMRKQSAPRICSCQSGNVPLPQALGLT
jgi:hypothetical protein